MDLMFSFYELNSDLVKSLLSIYLLTYQQVN